MTMTPPRPALAAAALLMLALAAPAQAHAFLQKADPAVGSRIATAPTELWIDFTESVEPAFSSITVTDAAGARVDGGKAAHPDGGDGNRLALDLPLLPPGTYRVVWHVVSTDTHRTEGSYSFRIAP